MTVYGRSRNPGMVDVMGLGGPPTSGMYAEYWEGTLTAGPVSVWSDRSGNGRHLTQAVGSLQPVKSAAGVTFDGVDDYLSSSGWHLNLTFSEVLVLTPSVTPVGLVQYVPTDSISGTYVCPTIGEAAGWGMYANTAVVTNSYHPPAAGVRQAVRCLWAGAGSKISVDGPVVSGNPGAPNRFGMYVGRSRTTNKFGGSIQYIGLYQGDITVTAFWPALVAWLGGVYGVTVG